jgi:uncharacterized protein DUF5946
VNREETPVTGAGSGAGATPPDREAYDELCAYTLAHGDPAFIHQHVVDAYMAQHADETTKPIGVTFALLGLYLHVEKRRTGRQVQLTHMQLGRRKRTWPTFALPRDRGTMTAIDVMKMPAGPERDQAIDAWAASVWRAFETNRKTIADLLEKELG